MPKLNSVFGVRRAVACDIPGFDKLSKTHSAMFWPYDGGEHV